jgi:DNA-binding transcriptional ArsR family regulator
METSNYRQPSKILKALAHPERLRLLNALRSGEECVCHLTALLRQRQAYVSQQLMSLRASGLIEDRKDGLRVYYRIKDERVLDLLDAANALTGVKVAGKIKPIECSCPKCETSLHGKRRKSR